MGGSVGVVQVLLLFDEKFSGEVGPALWASLIETEDFYNTASTTRADFERYYIAPSLPIRGPVETTLRGLGRRFFGDNGIRESLEFLSREQGMSSASVATDVSGRYSGTYDQHRLADAVRDLVKADDRVLHLVTDRELTPPVDWRYILWDVVQRGSVASTAPLDPTYWRDRSADRVSTIKKRLRSAILAITGQSVGMSHCANPECFLFGEVDSVLALDSMTELGPEHESDDLVGAKFEPVTDPSTIQRVVRRAL